MRQWSLMIVTAVSVDWKEIGSCSVTRRALTLNNARTICHECQSCNKNINLHIEKCHWKTQTLWCLVTLMSLCSAVSSDLIIQSFIQTKSFLHLSLLHLSLWYNHHVVSISAFSLGKFNLVTSTKLEMVILSRMKRLKSKHVKKVKISSQK